ncbi:MAG: TonB-dependent receptor plug domain-containing protein [Bacteroidota bacterium]
MKNVFRILFLYALISALTNTTQALAQERIKGQVKDKTGGQPLAGAEIQSDIKGNGTITDHNGYFELQLLSGASIIEVRYTGYKAAEIATGSIPIKGIFLIELQPDIVGLEEVNIIATYAKDRETPIAVSTIKTATIEREMGNQDYPEIMKMVPGVYATKLGGGTGDARISIRGFQQENIALLLNGVPVSSVENGLVYWSNWAGLGDATQTIQVQRGLGASRVALNSVGGTINIITKSSEARKGGSFRYAVSDYGNQKTILSLSTGRLKNDFSVTFLGSRTAGPGYTDACGVDAWAYFLTISKEISKSQKLVFTGLGSPERHGQRNYGLSNEQYEKYGGKYNPNWGMYNGHINNLSENFYHKPQLALNHYWNINRKAILASSAYVSFGTGGGKYSESFNSLPVSAFRKNNQIDWDAIYKQNTDNTDTTTLATGEKVTGFSKIIQTNYLASHIWFGGLTNLNYQLNENFSIISGLHARYFKSNLREEIGDLLGGRYWIDNYAWAIEGIGERSQIKSKGDIINVDNDTRVDVISYFIQAEYSAGKFKAFFASTVNNTWYRRYDRINYIQKTESNLITKPGADVKAGLNYNLNKFTNIYFNTGYYSKAPYFKFVFANFSNAVVQNLGNEKISSLEFGYNFRKSLSALSLNAYYTLWEDKSLLSHENIQLENSTDTRALIRGLDASHTGIEFEFNTQVLPGLHSGATASFGDWRWENDVVALLYNDKQELIDSTAVFVKDIKVGDAPQFTLGIFGEFSLLSDLSISANWMYYGNLYANFDPASRSNPDDRNQPYRIPDYSVADIHIGYNFKIGEIKSNASISCFNIFNNESILRGEDGTTHQLDSFSGFWSPGRTFSFSLRVEF